MLMPYPVGDGSDWDRLRNPPLLRRIKARVYHAAWTVSSRKRDGRLEPESGSFAPLGPNDIPVVCVMRDSIDYVRSFLRHYRRLGATRFIVVDDHSDDGTRAVLEAAPDLDLYVSPLYYKDTRRGQDWREALFDIYGRDRWYLSVDSDEFLIYPDFETQPLGAFIEKLERARVSRVHAVMLDIYPPGPLKSADFVDDGSAWPFDVSSMFDGDGYRVVPERFGNAIRGGPRKRLFGRGMRLSKFPLLWVDAATDYRRGSIHGPGPCYRNFVPVGAVLLHYQFGAHSMERFRRIVDVGGHTGNAFHYRAILDSDTFSEDLSLAYEGSVRFTGSKDLVKRGFMTDVSR